MTPEIRKLFRKHRENPMKVTVVEVRRQLGLSMKDMQGFYRLFYKAWKLDALDEVSQKRK